MLLQHHAGNCRWEECSVPNCAEIREVFRQRDEAAAQAAQTYATVAAVTTAADERRGQKRAAEDIKDDDIEAFEDYVVDNARPGFICSISHCLFRDPYITSDG